MASIRKRQRVTGDRWIVDYRDHTGRRRWVTHRSRREAEEARAEIVQASRQARPIPVNPNVALAAYATQWLETYTGDLAPSTRRGYEQILRIHLLPTFGGIKVREIHVGLLQPFLAKKRADGYSKNMVRLMRATLSVILGDAVLAGLLPMNPAAQLGRQRRVRADRLTRAEVQQKIRPLGPAQLQAVLSTACTHERRAAPYFLTLARAGLRPGEGLALQWGDLDFATREIHIERSLAPSGQVAPTKTHTARTVDMSTELAGVLFRLQDERKDEQVRRGWLEMPPWVFCSEAGTALGHPNVSKAWHRALREANLPSFRLYDLRHTYASTLLAQGAPITYVAAQLGHAKPTTTLAHYAHWLPRGEKRYVDALDTPVPGKVVAKW